MIQNDMKKNERVDAGVIISRLKKEVSDLKAELALLKGGQQKDSLTTEDVERCNHMVANFIKSDDPSASIVMPDRLMINQCFYHFKSLYQDLQSKKGGSGGGPKAIEASPSSASQKGAAGGGGGASSEELKSSQNEVNRLNLLVKQRDNEIGILLNYLNK